MTASQPVSLLRHNGKSVAHVTTAMQVVEAVLEDVGLKQRIFADLEKACRPDCILSSNTSTIDISLIGAKTRAQVRRLGTTMHAMLTVPCIRANVSSRGGRTHA